MTEVNQTLLNAAKTVYKDNPILAQVALTQALLESGNYTSKLAVHYNNLFGIKGKGTAGTVKLETSEYINKKWIKVYDNFAHNKTLNDSFLQHRRLLLDLPRYHKVTTSISPEQAFIELYKAGYATDPHYPQKLTKIWKQRVKPYF